MNLKALQLFQQIVLTGSLVEASYRTNVSTSAASRLLSLLESEIGLQLFSREKRQLTLSEEGDMFYRRVVRTLDALEEIPGIAKDIRNRSHNWLSIVTAAPIAGSLVSPALKRLHCARDDFRCSLNVETRFDIESKVAARGYNLGLISLPVENAILDLAVEPFLRARIEVLLHRDHPLTEQKEISIDEMAAQPIVTLRPRQRWRERLDELIGGAGLRPNVTFETSSTMVTLQMVRDGLGLTLADRAMLQLRAHDEATLRPLAEERWITYAGLYAKGPRSPLASPFLDAMSEVIEERRAADPAAAAALELI